MSCKNDQLEGKMLAPQQVLGSPEWAAIDNSHREGERARDLTQAFPCSISLSINYFEGEGREGMDYTVALALDQLTPSMVSCSLIREEMTRNRKKVREQAT